ncbi:hypothetical protein, partial [Klebsiella aerogenes]|uniref:hypothetical protein n=1 Tax=Klebsiella aerogenes TaxID=548 RepID=UPI001D0D6AE0
MDKADIGFLARYPTPQLDAANVLVRLARIGKPAIHITAYPLRRLLRQTSNQQRRGRFGWQQLQARL